MTATPRALAAARVLITGGSGLIGTPVVTAFRDAGCDVTVFDSSESITSDVPIIRGDICDPRAVSEAVEGVDIVVHLAGVPGLGQEDAITTYRVNTVGTFAVLACAADAGVKKVVYASSINAAGWPLNPSHVLPPNYPFDELSTSDIGDWYSLSKEANESAAAMFSQRSATSFTGLRYPLVRDIVADPEAFAVHLETLMSVDPRRAAAEGWSYLDASDAARATVAAAIAETPARPGILVAAPRTFLTISTEEALALSAPAVPRAPILGNDVPIDLGRSRTLLNFEARIMLEDHAPSAMVDLEGRHPEYA